MENKEVYISPEQTKEKIEYIQSQVKYTQEYIYFLMANICREKWLKIREQMTADDWKKLNNEHKQMLKDEKLAQSKEARSTVGKYGTILKKGKTGIDFVVDDVENKVFIEWKNYLGSISKELQKNSHNWLQGDIERTRNALIDLQSLNIETMAINHVLNLASKANNKNIAITKE